MAKSAPVFKALTKKPQRKSVPFFPSVTKKKKKETALVPVPVKAKKIVAAAPSSPNLKKASILDIQKAKITKTAKSQKKHGTAEEKKVQMQKAVAINPKLEKSSKAKSDQVDQMANAKKPGKFDSKKFSDDILNNIKKVIPKTEEEMDKDQTSSEKMATAQQNVTDSLEKEKQAANGDLPKTVNEAPDEASVTATIPTPLVKEDIGAYPSVSNSGFAPPLKTAQDNDLSADSKKIDNELANNNISEEQLQNGNEPTFDHSLTEKKESQKKAAGTHEQYLKLANPIAGATKSSTNALTLAGLAKMSATRNKQLSQLDKDKELKKQQETEVRTRVANDLNKIYEDTKLLVETRLKNLTEKVNKDFDEALDIANKAFEKNVKERTDTNWLEDLANWAMGIPTDIKKVFIEEQDNFINSLAPVVRKIGDFVEKELNQATNDIDEGKIKTKNYWENQDKDTKKIAGDVFTHATERFTELESKVEEANEGLKQSITTKFNAAVAKLEETFDRIQEENKSWLERAYDAVVGVIKAIIQMKNLLLNILAKVADVVGKIILDPIGFLSNLLDAIVLGFQNFGKNALEHLKKGFFEWLMGNMPPSIKFPKQWDLAGIFEFIMSVFGLTWENIKARATKLYGATVVAALETGFEIFQIIRKEGIGGLWNYIKEKIGNLKVMVVDAIQNMLIETVIKAGITWVISLFNPVGAFIKACKLIYDVISWFINNAKRILDLINSIVDSTALIVAGKISQAATFVENSLARLVPIAIGFLAGLLGLGDLSKKVQALLDKIQAPVNKAIDWVLEKAGNVVKTLFKAGKAGVKKLLSWIGLKKEFKAEDDKKHSINIEGNEKKPKLIIRSTPKTLEELIADFKTQQKYKNNKSKYDGRIESALRVKTKFENAMEKNQGKTGVDYNGQFEEMTQSLINYIKDLFVTSKAADKRNVSFGGESNGVANGMTANPLINDGTAGASTTGATGIYDTLFKRKHHGGNVPYYIQGHLLNHNLGGPNEKQNLTPLKRSTNSEHEAIIEKSLKKHYLEKKKLKYIVTPTYGLSSPLIASPTTPAQIKINEIKAQESKSVPISISIQSSYFMDEGGVEKEKSIFNGTIRNNIETDEKDYTL